MSCDEVRAAIAVYLDGELEPTASLEVERHLCGCDACTEAIGAERALRAAFAAPALRFDPPPGLEARVRRTVAQAARSAGARRRFPSWLAAAASFALGVALTAALARLGPAIPGGPALREGVLSAHLRSLQGDHLVDVPSSDQHTVKPWFAGKLPFSPTVPDLADAGFPLAGGRLDVLGGRPTAALVYRRRLHVINVFSRPAQGRDESAGPTASEDGYHLVHWVRGGTDYWAVSDVDPAELERFARLFEAAAR